jgi:EmrB/QacA subfamily drug resistance transporter
VRGGEKRKWYTLAAVALGAFMIMVDLTIVNVALPAIQEDFGFLETSVADLQWIVNAYALAFAVCMLTGGRLADLFGRRLLFVIGLVLFTAASVACGLADSLDPLIAARAVQGVGAALINPASLSIISATFPPQQRGMAIGIWSGVIGLGVAIGPLLGGVLTEIDWSWIFFVNIPVGILGVVAALLFIDESRDVVEDQRIDFPGLITSGLGLFGLIFALIKGNDFGWDDPRILGSFALAVVGFVLFAVIERGQREPIFDFSLFRSATFSGANAAGLLTGFAMLSMLFYGSLFTQNIMGYSAIEAGAAFLPLTLVMMFVSPVAGRLNDKVGPRLLIGIGLVMLTISLVLASRFDWDTSFWSLLPSFIVGGAGLALALTPITAAALAGVPIQKAGMGAGIVNTLRQAGGSLGLAVLGAIVAEETTASLLEGQSNPDAFVDGFGIIMLVAAGVTLLGAAIALLTVTRTAPAAIAAGPEGPAPRPSGSWVVAIPESVKGDIVQPPAPPAAAPAVAGAPAATGAGGLVPAGPEQVTAIRRRPPAPGAGPAVSPLALQVTEGLAAGRRLAVGYEPLVLGRAEPGDGKLGGDPELSRRHASVSRLNGTRVLVEDLGSSNGTFVNGHRIAAPNLIGPGDSLRVGTTTLSVVESDSPPEAPGERSRDGGVWETPPAGSPGGGQATRG